MKEIKGWTHLQKQLWAECIPGNNRFQPLKSPGWDVVLSQNYKKLHFTFVAAGF